MAQQSRFRRLMTGALATCAVAPALMLSGAGTASAASASSIVSIAQANLGNNGCGTNSAGGSGFYNSCSESWCADFAKWVWSQAGVDVSGLTPAAGSFGQYGAGLQSTPHVGDAAVFNYNGNGYAEHVSLVTSVNSDGTVSTIGGNQSGSVTRGTISSGGYYGSQHVSGYVSPIGGTHGNAGTEAGGLGRVRWADLDGDGKAEYIVINDNGTVNAYHNDDASHGQWTPLGQIATGLTSDRTRVRFADVDGDGKADYIVINPDNTIQAYRNVDAIHSKWEPMGQIGAGVSNDPTKVTFADFDGDGKTDVLTTNDNGAVTVYLNKDAAHGSWTLLGQVAGGLTSDRTRVRWTDLDGDGKADYTVINTNGSVTTYLNRGGDTGGGWTPISQAATGVTSNQNIVAFADINGDNRADYLVTNPNNSVTGYANNGPANNNANISWTPLGQIAAGA